MAYKIKKLEWYIAKGFLGEYRYTPALGMDWTIPVSNGTAQDNKRVEAEKEKAQNEFERAMQRWIEDGDHSESPVPDMRTSLRRILKMACDVKQLEWHLVRGFAGNRWRATALGLEWEIPEHDTKLEQRKEVAQLEFRTQVMRYIDDVSLDALPRPDVQEVSRRYKDAREKVFGPIIHADDKGNVTLTTPTAKDRVVDHLIQEHTRLSEDHRRAAEDGRVGLTQQQRERLKSIETALAIAVKDGEIVTDKSKEG